MRKISLTLLIMVLIVLQLSATTFANNKPSERTNDPTSLGRAVPDTGKRSDYDNGITETNGNTINDSNINRSYTNLNTYRAYADSSNTRFNWNWLGLLGLIGLVGLNRSRGTTK
jgi:hypothetical protein